MNLLSFHDFLNENSGVSGEVFVDEFINNIATEIPKLGSPEDVWCMPKDLFNAYRREAADVSLLAKAENFESEQRRLPSTARLKSPYFLVEYRIDAHGMHVYRMLGIDTETKEMFFAGHMGGFEDKIEKVFEDLLKKYYPVLSTSRKYGL